MVSIFLMIEPLLLHDRFPENFCARMNRAEDVFVSYTCAEWAAAGKMVFQSFFMSANIQP